MFLSEANQLKQTIRSFRPLNVENNYTFVPALTCTAYDQVCLNCLHEHTN